ncbi:MAG: M48 family peptidase [Chloroflexi bacterium AL-W]|nr:M48 family peptidase [Chloroflexi bacterium AL-W]
MAQRLAAEGQGARHSAAFGIFGVFFMASDLIATLLGWYRAFVIKEQFDFNRRTHRVYWTDKLKGYVY